MRGIISTIVFLLFTLLWPSFILANQSINFGSCTLVPKKLNNNNPTIVGDTFSIECSGVENTSNVYNYVWTNGYNEVVNKVAFVVGNNTSRSFWHYNLNNNLYSQEMFEYNREFSIGDNLNYKIMLNPNSNVVSPGAKATLTFYNCGDNRIQSTCHVVGQEVLDISTQTDLLKSDFSLSDSTLDFSELELGVNLDKSFSVINNSSIDLVAKITKKSGSKDAFSISNDLLSKLDTSDTFTVSAGSTASYNVSFSPSSEKEYKLQIEFKPKDTMMAKYVESKNITFKGSGIKTTTPLNLNLETVSQNEVTDKTEFSWKLSGTGDVKDLPWTIEITTNCEEKGLENGGSFKWGITDFSSDKPFDFNNSLESKWVESESNSSVLVKDKNDAIIYSQDTQFKSCYSELPEAEAGLNKSILDSSQNPPSSSLDSRSQKSKSPNGQSGSPSFTLDAPKLTDLENEELNFNKDVKGASDSKTTKDFWIRILTYVAGVGGLALAVWYSKKEMLKNVVIIPEETIDKNTKTDKPVKSIKLE